MKKDKLTGKPPDIKIKTGVWNAIRMYFSVLRILHSGLGAPRIIAAYLFFAFALLSLLFTVRTPLDSDSMPHLRLLTGFMIIMNLGVYGIVMNWHKSGRLLIVLRLIVTGLLLYLDVFILLRGVYAFIH